ncbi:MAG: hypothetical protein AB8B55_00685 [Mariniblastus sp.]
MKKKRSHRRGGILIAALVCMAVATIILLTVLQSSNRQRVQLRSELQIEQVRWLVDGGISKAIQELENDKSYSGETIVVSPTLDEKTKSTVEISIDRKSNAAGEPVVIKVTAIIERAGQVLQRTKEIKLNEEEKSKGN